MQANRMRRLLKTTLPRMQPPCVPVDSNRGSMMFAQNVQHRLTSTVVGKKSDDSNLVTRNLKFAKIAMFSPGGGQNLGCNLWVEEGKRALCVAYLGWQCQTHLWLLSLFSRGSQNNFFWQFSIAEQCRSWKIFLSPTQRYWLIPLGTNTIYSDFSARKASDLVSHKILFWSSC